MGPFVRHPWHQCKPRRIIFDTINLTAELEIHALSRKLGTQNFGDVGIHPGKDFFHHFDHRHFNANHGKEAGEFQTDHPATDDGELFGQGLDFENTVGIKHVRLIQTGDRRTSRGGTRADHNVFTGVGFVTNGNGVRVDDLAQTARHFDLEFLHQTGDALAQASLYTGLTFHGSSQIKADITGNHAKVSAVGCGVIGLGRSEQRLGGNAAPVQADATEFFLFHQKHFHAVVTSTFRGDIPAGTSTNNN